MRDNIKKCNYHYHLNSLGRGGDEDVKINVDIHNSECRTV